MSKEPVSKAPLNRGEPPETPEHWGWLYDGAEKGHKGWPIVAPFVAAATNLKAWGFIGAALIGWNHSEIIKAARILLGVME